MHVIVDRQAVSSGGLMSPISAGGSSVYDESEQRYNEIDDSCTSPRNDRSNTNAGSNAKRGVLPKEAITLMKTWLFQHIVVSFTPIKRSSLYR